MSKQDIKARIEKILSDILSDKHDCKIIIKFGGDANEGRRKSKTVDEK